jgi:repressor LexA
LRGPRPQRRNAPRLSIRLHLFRIMAMNLTPKQLRILQLIRDSRITRGYSPTMQELADELGVSKVTVFEHVEALIKKGALLREPNKARSLSLPDDALVPDETRPLAFPLVGKIAAGYPIEKFAHSDQLSLEDVFGPRVGQKAGSYALRVEGDSMRDEGILDGDYVIVERRETARNGERIVALLPDGETTLKTFHRESDGRVRLQPANPDFKPIIVKNCKIQGIVVGVLRRY